MITASLTGFLKTLIILIGIYWLLKILLRRFMPNILRFFIRRMASKAEQKYNAQNPNFNSKKKTGKTSIDYIPPNEYKSNKDTGEYIDYEEID